MHDYAKSVAKAKQQRSKKKKKKTSRPLGLVILTLLAVTAFTGGIYYLSQVDLEADALTPAPAPKVVEKSSRSKTTNKAKPEPTTESRFEFYELLRETEVMSTGEDAYKLPSKKKELQRYMLQAGSFKNYDDADRLRAKLILEGLSVQLKAVKSKNGRTWHRVMVGPFNNRSQLNQAQDTLARNNTEFMLVKLPK